jgi:hypothetical protein
MRQYLRAIFGTIRKQFTDTLTEQQHKPLVDDYVSRIAESVMRDKGQYSAMMLMKMTRKEPAWQEAWQRVARNGCPSFPDEPLSTETMRTYFARELDDEMPERGRQSLEFCGQGRFPERMGLHCGMGIWWILQLSSVWEIFIRLNSLSRKTNSSTKERAVFVWRVHDNRREVLSSKITGSVGRNKWEFILMPGLFNGIAKRCVVCVDQTKYIPITSFIYPRETLNAFEIAAIKKLFEEYVSQRT